MDVVVYPPLENELIRGRGKIKTVVTAAVLICLAIFIKIISNYPNVVEKYYSLGLYPYISGFFRKLFGWLPFSFGDIIYFVAGCYLLWLFVKLVRAIFQKRLGKIEFFAKAKAAFFTIILIYIVFNISWGLNYNRPGIGAQLGLTSHKHNLEDLKKISGLLIRKLNDSRIALGSGKIQMKPYRQIFEEAQQAYHNPSTDFPKVDYKNLSVKRSMYGRLGNFLGFLGYYNPFTGEAQLNLTMPRFLIPYVTCHELAHQLGYANESEASFVGYLVASNSGDALFQYSAYFDLYSYTNHELYIRDSAAAINNYQQLDAPVKADILEVRKYWTKSDNIFEPFVKKFYDRYLKANQQIKGIYSYNEVVGLLIAYNKKYGKI